MERKSPDYELAAVRAAETLVKHNISSAPVSPLHILKRTPGVIVLTFAEMAMNTGLERKDIIATLATYNRDVVTSVANINGKLRYIVAYNQRLPLYMLHRALARELGHIILQHDGSLPEAARMEEAVCFARHLLCPRPLIRALQESISPLTIDTVGYVTGCFERCMRGIKVTPGTHVPPALNRAVRDLFEEYVNNFIDCQSIITYGDHSDPADFGTYMEGYEE